jgi:hypothetical protein
VDVAREAIAASKRNIFIVKHGGKVLAKWKVRKWGEWSVPYVAYMPFET